MGSCGASPRDWLELRRVSARRRGRRAASGVRAAAGRCLRARRRARDRGTRRGIRPVWAPRERARARLSRPRRDDRCVRRICGRDRGRGGRAVRRPGRAAARAPAGRQGGRAGCGGRGNELGGGSRSPMRTRSGRAMRSGSSSAALQIPRSGTSAAGSPLDGGENGANREGLYWSFELWLREQESACGSITAGNGAIYALRRSAYLELGLGAKSRSGLPVPSPPPRPAVGLRARVGRARARPARDRGRVAAQGADAFACMGRDARRGHSRSSRPASGVFLGACLAPGASLRGRWSSFASPGRHARPGAPRPSARLLLGLQGVGLALALAGRSRSHASRSPARPGTTSS